MPEPLGDTIILKVSPSEELVEVDAARGRCDVHHLDKMRELEHEEGVPSTPC